MTRSFNAAAGAELEAQGIQRTPLSTIATNTCRCRGSAPHPRPGIPWPARHR